MSSGPKPHPPQPPVDLPGKVKHGGFTAYRTYKCRCGLCQAHMRAYANATYKNRLRGRPVPEDKHGTLTGYTYYDCRCDQCREHHAEYEYRRKIRKLEEEP